MTGTNSDKLATFDQLIATGGKRRFTTATTPIGGLTFRIRSLMERELSSYQSVIQAAPTDKSRQVRLAASNRRFIALCLVDKDGNLLVPADRVSDLTELDAADSAHLYEECVQHCGVSAADLDALVKNSKPTTPSSSPTSSETPTAS